MSKPFSRPKVPAGACEFGWQYWNALYQEFNTSGWRSEERWQLAALHSKHSLNALARWVVGGLKAAGTSAKVSAESFWIDGTPQVQGYLPSGKKLAQCELADLLFIVNQMDMTGKLVNRTGVLLQGKTVKRHDALPSNPSTKKERLLLEGLCRTRPLSVYRDVNLTGHIGDYTFGIGTGLRDCARYLMMPKKANWCPGCTPCEPLQIGWPKNRSSNSIAPTTSFLAAMRDLAISGTVGRVIRDKGPAAACEWSRLVWDLLGDFKPGPMTGYGGQSRANSSNVMSFMGSNYDGYVEDPPAPPPELLSSLDVPPAISVIQVNIRTFPIDQRPVG
ncbi:hypothetical protein NWF24_30875 [Variovorax paradoxus]|uniref:hypothetical protein n=1 Tax=Variovorax paradoxus TaxID=34073 RepID=UPI0021AC9434|nr:hypothetical protein [Variovorax paradoxus]UVH57194.1 hypothetical protein NWF24_30875 [Variovorax paradoxus]